MAQLKFEYAFILYCLGICVCTDARAQEKEPIKIAFIAPLTGPFCGMGI